MHVVYGGDFSFFTVNIIGSFVNLRLLGKNKARLVFFSTPLELAAEEQKVKQAHEN